MSYRIHVQPDEQIELDLTEAERTALERVASLDTDLESAVRRTPPGEPVCLTLEEFDELAGWVAAEANHTKDKKLGKTLDGVFKKIDQLLATYSDEDSPPTLSIADAKKAKLIADHSAQLADHLTKAQLAADELDANGKPIDFGLQESDRAILALLPGLAPALKEKLESRDAEFTVGEIISMTTAVADSLPHAEPAQQAALLFVTRGLIGGLTHCISPTGAKAWREKTRSTSHVYQFKITLLGTKPPIWRRIQVKDCTLDKLHEHIQTAMGWTNSHLHHFKFDDILYGDPMLLEEDFEEMGYQDSTSVKLSELHLTGCKPFGFEYEYDFGDDWRHDVWFEGCPAAQKGVSYPLCVEGEKACPPEDVGGVESYDRFLAALADPSHEEHETYQRLGRQVRRRGV